MSLQVLYSFDHVLTADLPSMPRVITSPAPAIIVPNAGRDGSGCMSIYGDGLFSGFDIALVQAHNDVTFGAWVVNETQPGVSSGYPIIQFCNPTAQAQNSNESHVGITPKNDGSLHVNRGWTVFSGSGPIGDTPPGVISYGQNAAYYIEVRVVIGNTGSVTIAINGATVLTLTNVDTMMNNDPNVTYIRLGGNESGQARVRFDDVYILTGLNNGDGWTTPRGVIKVDGKLANAAGDTTQWTPSVPTGVNYQNVDEPTPNTTDFNDALTVGLIDLYNIEDVAFDPAAIQVDLYMRKLDAGPSSVAHTLRSGGITYVHPEPMTLTPGYRYQAKPYTRTPANQPWTMSLFNALQAGPQKAV